MKRKFNPTLTAAYVLFGLSLLVAGLTAYFVFNLKVLDSWKLDLAATDIHVGDTVVVQSTYNKIRPAAGESVRYIECKNRTGVWVRYELNRATANRAAGKGGTGVVLTVRRDIADVPTTCKFTIVIRYDVLPFRHIYNYNSTKEFTLQTERTTPPESVSSEPIVTTRNSQFQVQPSTQVSNSYSSSNTTFNPQSSQQDTSQKPPENQPSQPPAQTVQPGLLDQLLTTVKGIL